MSEEENELAELRATLAIERSGTERAFALLKSSTATCALLAEALEASSAEIKRLEALVAGEPAEDFTTVLEESPEDPISSVDFGPMFRRLREVRGYTMGDVSRYLLERAPSTSYAGIYTVAYVSDVERGKRLPGSQEQTEMAEAIGLVQGEATTEMLRSAWEKKRAGF